MPLQVGLIGYPVEHSLSPVFQQVAFDMLGIDARYALWSTPAEDLPQRVELLRQPDVLGANVTIPHKTRVFDLVDETSELARRAGAVNTVVNQDGELFGDNTDIPGFLAPLIQRDLSIASITATILGAGGAARGVSVALQSSGCRNIIIANRTVERARDLAHSLGDGISAAPLDDSLANLLRETTLLINATSIGWQSGDLPLPEALLHELPPAALVYDLTYRETPLLQSAQRRGLETIDGLPMLVHQGAESFRLWTGEEPPLAEMLAAAAAARDSRAGS